MTNLVGRLLDNHFAAYVRRFGCQALGRCNLSCRGRTDHTVRDGKTGTPSWWVRVGIGPLTTVGALAPGNHRAYVRITVSGTERPVLTIF